MGHPGAEEMAQMDEVTIRSAVTGEEIESVRGLMVAYGVHLAANPSGAARICIPDYEREIAALPGPYASPEGLLLLAARRQEPAGCVGLKPVRAIGAEERVCEMKRLWVGSGFRGLGLGRRLVEAAIAWACAAGYHAMYLDTVPAAMPEANALYERLGFQRVERYNDNPVEDVIFFRLLL